MTTTHAIERTSPKGGKFIGTCMRCGLAGLTFADMGKPCENVSGMTEDEALLMAVEGPSREKMSWPEIANFLWSLLDDIDTASDRAKSDDATYRVIVERIQRRRFEVGSTDGYTVTFHANAVPVTDQQAYDLGYNNPSTSVSTLPLRHLVLVNAFFAGQMDRQNQHPRNSAYDRQDYDATTGERTLGSPRLERGDRDA